MNTMRQCILVLGAALIFLSPAVRSQQPQKATRLSQEDRIKKLEERADAAEKAADSAAMERDYNARSQKQYESYYQKALNAQTWTLGIMGLILIAVFGLAARFSLNMLVERAKMASAEATVQMRNEYARTLAKEVQKLCDSNAADIRKLKEALTAKTAELEQDLKDRSDFQIQFVQGLAGGDEGDAVLNFRKALRAYKSGKARKLLETKVGSATLRYIFESFRQRHEKNYVEQAREEMADPLYNGLQEELALAALQSSWLTPLITERKPPPPEPPVREPAVEPRPAARIPEVPAETGLSMDEEADSCRLIES